MTRKTLLTPLTLLIVTLIALPIVSLSPLVFAQSANTTPQSWIDLITQSPDGAWRPTQGVTQYPWTNSPACTPERTGYTSSNGPLTNHTLWRANVPLHNWAFGVVANGTVYAFSMDQNALFALNAYTGEELWHYSLPITEQTPTGYSIFGDWNNDNWLSLVNNQILVGMGDEEKTMMVGTQSGELEWISPEGRVALVTPPGTVFERGYGVYLTFWETQKTICYQLRFNEQVEMNKVWESSSVTDRLSYYEGKVYGAVHDQKWVSCADARTGDLIWNYTTPDPDNTFYQHPVIADGRAYFPMSYVNKMVVLNANTGDFLWDLTLPESDYFNNVAVANGKLYISGGTESAIYCRNAVDGTEIWTAHIAGPSEYYFPLIAQDKLYVSTAAAPFEGFPAAGTYQGYMYCLDANSGSVIWRYLTPTNTVNAWLADGNLYSSAPFGYMWCWGAGPTTTEIATTSTSLAAGNKLVVSGSVEDMSPFSQQEPGLQSPWVKDASVVLSYAKDNGWTDFATIKTDANGQFKYEWTPDTGSYAVVARFEGNDAYQWSSDKVTIQVGTGSSGNTAYSLADPIYLVAAVLIVVVICVVVVVFLRRRK